MKKKNVLSEFTKVDKETIIGVEKTAVDLIPIRTQNGEVIAVVFDDNTFTYAPSADYEWLKEEVLTDDECMNEFHTIGVTTKVVKHTSKSTPPRDYYTMFA